MLPAAQMIDDCEKIVLDLKIKTESFYSDDSPNNFETTKGPRTVNMRGTKRGRRSCSHPTDH
jgi:hypothetical protein